MFEVGSRVILRPNVHYVEVAEEAQGTIIPSENRHLTDMINIRFDNGASLYVEPDHFSVTSEPRMRPEDQPIPTPNDEESSHDVLVREIEKRKELGLSRYGTKLQPFNGRDSLQDAIEEAIDMLVYLIQVKRERDARLEEGREPTM